MKQTLADTSDHHCTVLEQKQLVSEMSHCDRTAYSHQTQYECYLKATQKSRKNNSCMYS